MGYYDQVLEHHGIKGQKWGVRRFQRADGSLTPAGLKRQKRQDVLDDLEKKATKHDQQQKEAYDKSKIGQTYKKWRKAHPNADEDDFGDYLVDHNIQDDFNYKKNTARHEKDMITGKEIKSNLAGYALISSLTIAPIVGGLTTMGTGSFKKGFDAYVATVGATTMYGLGQDVHERYEIEKKYGLR